MKPLFKDNEWTFDRIERTWEVIDKIATEKYGLDYHKPQIEMVSADQMLDSMVLQGAMPVSYNHWSWGKRYIQAEKDYKAGRSGLAYEVIIHTNPLIAYLMEDNTMTMQTLVLAHSIAGHGSFFKNNYLFKEGTDPSTILDYLVFAKDYIRNLEESEGHWEVEDLLDAAHSLAFHGVDRYKRDRSQHAKKSQKHLDEWLKYKEGIYDENWRIIPWFQDDIDAVEAEKYGEVYEMPKGLKNMVLPEENILYFLEKYSPILKDSGREVLRIVRKISQYFYPHYQTKVMNEGWASFMHYHLLRDLHDEGHITDGSYMEALHNHTNVCYHDHDNLSGFGNPYTLGFNMFMDIKRICQEPDKEDEELFPDIANTDWIETTKDIVENYRDESFIHQFLSPKMAQKFNLMALKDDASEPEFEVAATQDPHDLRNLRRILSDQYSFNTMIPHIEIVKVDWLKDRRLHLKYIPKDKQKLHEEDLQSVLYYIRELWGSNVELTT